MEGMSGGGTPWGTIIGAIIGGALGVEKHYEDKASYKQDKAMEATKARYYPWLGLAPRENLRPSHAQNVGGGILAGAQAGSGIQTKNPWGDNNPKPMTESEIRGLGNNIPETGKPGYETFSGSETPGYALNTPSDQNRSEEMMQAVADVKKREQAQALARQNPWLAMSTMG